MSLPALVLLMFAAITAVTAVRLQVECVDAARGAVLAAARGEDGLAAGQELAPPGAQVSIAFEGTTVRASVAVHVDPLGGNLPGFQLSTAAVTRLEPGEIPGAP